MTSRAERKARAQKRRDEIILKISNIMQENLERGLSLEDSMKKADVWLNDMIRVDPRNRSIYETAARQYCDLFDKAAEKYLEKK